MKLYLLSCCFLGIALSLANANCSGDCPDTEDVVWALGGTCIVFRNKCFFDQENCVRRPALIETTKEECQQQCPDMCPANYLPTTGNYNGQIREFGNICLQRAHSCRTGETYL